MPLIVAPGDFQAWLDPASKPGEIHGVITAGARTEWTSRRVGPFVNNVRNDGPENIRPAEPATPPQGSLF
jgi:putative SOS response-associated peptidase YedK